ncbi:MAG: hypothetical protein ACXVPU_02130 [Bacteroidia bacterium]
MTLSTLLGLIAGILLTISTEIIRKAINRRTVAAKLFSDSIATLRDILETDKISFVATAKKMYAEKNPSESEKLLNETLNTLKEKMSANKSEIIESIEKLKSDKLGCEKSIYFSQIIEDKFKNDCLILSKSEVSLLTPIMQSKVNELIENYFYAYVNYRFLVLRVNSQDVAINIDMFLDDLIETYKYMIKIYKDRETIHGYSEKIANQSLLKGIFKELRLRNK